MSKHRNREDDRRRRRATTERSLTQSQLLLSSEVWIRFTFLDQDTVNDEGNKRVSVRDSLILFRFTNWQFDFIFLKKSHNCSVAVGSCISVDQSAALRGLWATERRLLEESPGGAGQLLDLESWTATAVNLVHLLSLSLWILLSTAHVFLAFDRFADNVCFHSES